MIFQDFDVSFIDDPNDLDYFLDELELISDTDESFEYPLAMKIAHRYPVVSHRIAALMINSVLKDLGVKDPKKYVSISRVRKMKAKIGFETDESVKRNGLIGLKFDGKKTNSLQPHNKELKMNLITVVSEPEGEYVRHFESGGTGLAMANGLYQTLEETGSIDTILAIGCGKVFFIIYLF